MQRFCRRIRRCRKCRPSQYLFAKWFHTSMWCYVSIWLDLPEFSKSKSIIDISWNPNKRSYDPSTGVWDENKTQLLQDFNHHSIRPTTVKNCSLMMPSSMCRHKNFPRKEVKLPLKLVFMWRTPGQSTMSSTPNLPSAAPGTQQRNGITSEAAKQHLGCPFGS